MRDEILALRFLKILPDDRWLSASALAKAYAEKFHAEITTAKETLRKGCPSKEAEVLQVR